MSISLKTHKLLWGRSGNKCAFEECRNDLVADETETDDESIIGDEAHIVAKKPDGSRGDSELASDDRDKYDNLILLCRKHHKIIDDQPNHYTVVKLKEIKKRHEAWVKNTLTIDKEKESDDLKYATYIDEIVNLLDIENWNAWTSWVLGSSQSLDYSQLQNLEKLPNYIVSRFWPNRYLDLEKSIYNLKAVVNDFLQVFHKHMKKKTYKNDKTGEDEHTTVRTETFYKTTLHEQEVYDRLLLEYEYHVALVDDLMIEMTRAANLVIEKIRKYLSPQYRETEGKLIITMGPGMDFSYRSYKVEYKAEEKSLEYPYQGLKNFMTERETRDFCVGEGYNKNYFLEF